MNVTELIRSLNKHKKKEPDSIVFLVLEDSRVVSIKDKVFLGYSNEKDIKTYFDNPEQNSITSEKTTTNDIPVLLFKSLEKTDPRN